MSERYEIYAILYGTSERLRSQSFMGGDPNDGPMAMGNYFWLIRNEDRAVVVDTGASRAVMDERKRNFLIAPDEALRKLGTEPDEVRDVILTHLHWDHCGNHDLFRHATFHLQASEMAYATGPWMAYPFLRAGYDVTDVKAMADRVFDDRITFHTGRTTVLPGIELIHVGGHCAGLQSVIVSTQRGPVVVASDAVVFYECVETGRPFPSAFHPGDELAGYRTLLEIAGSLDAVIPGHDTMVMSRFPEVVKGVAWRVDGAPIA